MRLLILTLFIFMGTSENFTINFGSERQGNEWRTVNDDVMGGRSNSEAVLRENSIYFKGKVSLENNGGFASIRSPYDNYDLSQYNTVTLRFRGTSRKFALSLYTSKIWFRANYKYEFTPNEDGWQELTIPLEDFKQTRVGRFTGKTIAKKKLEEVIQIGIILFDKKSGPFELEIDYISFQ